MFVAAAGVKLTPWNPANGGLMPVTVKTCVCSSTDPRPDMVTSSMSCTSAAAPVACTCTTGSASAAPAGAVTWPLANDHPVVASPFAVPYTVARKLLPAS